MQPILDPTPPQPCFNATLSFEEIQSLIKDDITHTDRLVQQHLASDVHLINQLGSYIVNGGGKRLRPLIVLLSARALNAPATKSYQAAAIIEFIHTATLLHDDVVDGSTLRRGKSTANTVWGNEASVLVGDFLYSRAFEMMVELGNLRVMQIMANTTNTIAEGEVMQLLNAHDASIDEAHYIHVLQCKTAKLFEAAAQIGAILGEHDQATCEALGRYGAHLGTAFQLIDDALDYSADPRDTGKNLGDDLAEGKPTLPLIHAMRAGSKQQAALIKASIESGGRENIDSVLEVIEQTGALNYTVGTARVQATIAIDAIESSLPDSIHKSALISLAEFSVNRSF